MVERHSTAMQASEADQEAVFELLREHLFRLFGPGGSFRVTLGRATTDDAVFVETVADTIAWDVTASLTASQGEGSHAADPVSAQAAHEELWRHVERELLLRRTGPQSVDADVEREVAAAGIRSVHAA